MSDRADRHNLNKVCPSMVPIEIILGLAWVYFKGALKYSRDNWKQGMPWSECLDSHDRHMIKYKMGQTYDHESKLHHLLHAMWNLGTLYYYELYGLGEDDRPKCLEITDDLQIKGMSSEDN